MKNVKTSGSSYVYRRLAIDLGTSNTIVVQRAEASSLMSPRWLPWSAWVEPQRVIAIGHMPIK